MGARNDNYVEIIDHIYDEDGDNKLDKDKMQQAELNGMVPTLTTDIRALVHCG